MQIAHCLVSTITIGKEYFNIFSFNTNAVLFKILPIALDRIKIIAIKDLSSYPMISHFKFYTKILLKHGYSS